jgi:MFS transporter, DHA2 family, multidrug resistance protein
MLMVAMLLVSIDSTIANVALPHIQGSVSASQDQISWVLTSYIVAAAISTPLTGWLTRRFSVKTVYLTAIAGFTLSSVLCGLTPGLPELVFFRLAQGAFGAVIMPLAQATLLTIYPREMFASVMGLFSIGALTGPIIGPTLGGWLTDTLSWRWVFFINLPFGIIAFLGLLALLQKGQRGNERFDYLGYIALAVSLGSFQLMMDRGQLHDWFGSPETWIEAGLAAVGFTIFLILNVTTQRPVISLAPFRHPSFAIASVFSALIGVALFSSLALTPTMLETLFGYPSMTTGLVTAPRGLSMLLTVIGIARFGHLMSIRASILIGWMLLGISQWWMSEFTLAMDWRPIVIASFVQGIGTGLVFSQLTAAAFNALPQHLRTDGSALYVLVRNLGSSLGISSMAALQINNTSTIHSSIVDGIRPAAEPGLFDLSSQPGLQSVDNAITRASSMAAYATDFKIIAVIIFVTLPMALLLKETERAGSSAKTAAAAAE